MSENSITFTGMLAEQVAASWPTRCAWCGGDLLPEEGAPYVNRRGEAFCSEYHRRASNAAAKRPVEAAG